MLNGCGVHLLRCLQQVFTLFLGFADEFTRASGPHIHEYAPVRFALRLASGLPHSWNASLLGRRVVGASRAGACPLFGVIAEGAAKFFDQLIVVMIGGMQYTIEDVGHFAVIKIEGWAFSNQQDAITHQRERSAD